MYPNHVPADHNGANGSSSERLVIVVGDNGLTLRFIRNLTSRYGYRVVALILKGPGGQRDELRREADINPRLQIFERNRINAESIRDVGLVEAYAVALMAQDDVGNLHLALKIREMSHEMADETLPKLVIRMYNRQLRERIRLLLGDEGVYVESDADMVSRTYAASALGQIPPGDMEIWGRRLYLKREADPRAQAQWPVASGNGGAVEMLSTEGGETVRVLCLEPENKVRWFQSRPEAAARFVRGALWGLRRAIDTKLRIVALALMAVLSAGIWALSSFDSESVDIEDGWDALYVITLIAGGGIDPDMKADDQVKFTHAIVILAGSLLIPVVTGAIVQALVAQRYARAEGTIVERVRDHVIVVGLGNLGSRVVEELRRRRVPVVAVEKDRDAVGVLAARAAGAQVLLGDASRPETLQQAEIKHCRSLVAMARQDSANLEAALSGLECNPDLRTVLRIYNPEFARLVRRNLNRNQRPSEAGQHSSFSAPEVAAASFAAALTDDEILETIPVRGHLAYIVEVPIEPGAQLDDSAVHEATSAGSHMPLAVRRASGGIRWNPDAAFRIRAGDKLLVLATARGLEEVRERCQILSPRPPSPRSPDRGETSGSVAR